MKAIIITIAAIALSLFSYHQGQKHKQNEIEERAKGMPSDCINESQLEVIIFGEVQL